MLDAFNEKRKTVIDLLGQLTDIAAGLGANSTRDHIQKGVVNKLEDNLFRLVVVGEFNHGKTTFVNALLGAHVLPIGITPTTAVIHQIQYDEHPQACVVYESGLRRGLQFEEVKDFAIGNPAPVPDPGPVRVLEIGYPAEILRQRIALVDTPGVNDLSLARAEITYDYIPHSDAVLFLLDAGQLVKESERVFLQQKLLGQSRDRIVFVITKRDILRPDELEQAVDYVHAQLRKLVDNPRVFCLSAEKCLKGLREESGMDELLDYLAGFLSQERGRIMLDNSLGDGLRACNLLAKGIDAKRRALQMSIDEIDRRVASIEEDLASQATTIEQRQAAIREEVAAIKAWTKRDLDRFVLDVCQQIPRIVDEAEVSELKAHLGEYLERTFRDWAHQQTQEIATALENLAERTIALVNEDARDAGRRLATMMGSDLSSPVIDVDIFVFDVGVAALAGAAGVAFAFSSFMLGGALLAAAPLLAWIARGHAAVETRNKAKELAPKAMQDAAASVWPKLAEMIDGFAINLDAWVVTAGEEVHREVLDVLIAARGERERGEGARAISMSDCQHHEARLGALRSQLEALRGQ